VGSALTRGLAKLPGRGHDLKMGYRLQQVWPKLVGEMMARYMFPVDVSGDRLTVGVTSAVFLQEAEYMRDGLLVNLARELGEGRIRHLAFKMLPAAPKVATAPKTAMPVAKPLSHSETDHLERELARITDPELREKMRRVLSKSLERYRG